MLNTIAVIRLTPFVAVALADNEVPDEPLLAAFELLELLLELEVDVDPIDADLSTIAAQAAELAVPVPTFDPILAATA